MKPKDKKKKAISRENDKPLVQKETNESKSNIKVSSSYSNPLLFNIIFLIVAFLIIKRVFKPMDDPKTQQNTTWNAGYDWMYNLMMKENVKFAHENSKLNVQEKYVAKWNNTETNYLFDIKKYSDEKDIILFPPRAVIEASGLKSLLVHTQVLYFIYPRKVVYSDSLGTIPSQCTKVLSINGWGLSDKVEKPDSMKNFMILKIKK